MTLTLKLTTTKNNPTRSNVYGLKRIEIFHNGTTKMCACSIYHDHFSTEVCWHKMLSSDFFLKFLHKPFLLLLTMRRIFFHINIKFYPNYTALSWTPGFEVAAPGPIATSTCTKMACRRFQEAQILIKERGCSKA